MIGTGTPNVANFTDVTASTLSFFENTISLSNPLSAQHGLLFVVQNSLASTMAQKFTCAEIHLDQHKFSQVSIGNGTSISSIGNKLLLKTSGMVILPGWDTSVSNQY